MEYIMMLRVQVSIWKKGIATLIVGHKIMKSANPGHLMPGSHIYKKSNGHRLAVPV